MVRVVPIGFKPRFSGKITLERKMLYSVCMGQKVSRGPISDFLVISVAEQEEHI